MWFCGLDLLKLSNYLRMKEGDKGSEEKPKWFWKEQTSAPVCCTVAFSIENFYWWFESKYSHIRFCHTVARPCTGAGPEINVGGGKRPKSPILSSVNGILRRTPFYLVWIHSTILGGHGPPGPPLNLLLAMYVTAFTIEALLTKSALVHLALNLELISIDRLYYITLSAA